MDLYKKHFLNYDTSYFDQFIGNEKWKTKIDCPQMDLPHHYGIIDQYDNINKYEGFINGGKSQNGEDGILKYIFDTIGVQNKYYVEFGAGDGIWCSNTYYFRNKEMWNGLLLEGNIESVNKGSKNINLHHEHITPDNINVFVYIVILIYNTVMMRKIHLRTINFSFPFFIAYKLVKIRSVVV